MTTKFPFVPSRTNARLLALVAVAAAGQAAHADIIDPWQFNVFARSSIGSPSAGYGSTIAGPVGSVGDARFQNISLGANMSGAPSGAKAFHGGGDLTLSGSLKAGLDTAGTVYMNNASVQGGLVAGGNLAGSGGSVKGGATLGGTKTTGNALSVQGQLRQNVTYSASVDLAGASAFFAEQSAIAGSLAPTGSFTNQWGTLSVTLADGLNVISVAGQQLDAAHTIRVTGSADATLVINVAGSHVSFDSLTWTYVGGASSSRTLLNLPEATSFALSGGNHNVNILAPDAAVHFSSGQMNGTLVAGTLTGAGAIGYTGGFTGSLPGTAIPTPAPAALLAAGLFVALRRDRRQSAARSV